MQKAAQIESKSLKTFFLYVFLVFVLIFISLIVKVFFVIQQSKFDSPHDFSIAILQQKNVKEIIAFHPQTPSIEELTIEDNNVSYSKLTQQYGIHTDGYIQINNSSTQSDISAFLWSSLLHTADWQTDLTAYDKIRLLLLSKNVTPNNKTNDPISLVNETPDVETTITNTLTDQDIADENISIQIINATDITGFGQRLGKVLTNMGANVVDISTGQDLQKKTTIQYFGNESYTVDRLQKLLGVKATKLTNQPIADIVITLGTDKKNTTDF